MKSYYEICKNRIRINIPNVLSGIRNDLDIKFDNIYSIMSVGRTTVVFLRSKKELNLDQFIRLKKYCLYNIPLLRTIKKENGRYRLEGTFTIY